MSVNIVVPEMGESIVDARIARWLKKEGDAVAVGEPLVELETDKVDVEVNAPQNGVLEQIAHAEGADVKIGDVLGTIAEGARLLARGWRRNRRSSGGPAQIHERPPRHGSGRARRAGDAVRAQGGARTERRAGQRAAGGAPRDQGRRGQARVGREA